MPACHSCMLSIIIHSGITVKYKTRWHEAGSSLRQFCAIIAGFKLLIFMSDLSTSLCYLWDEGHLSTIYCIQVFIQYQYYCRLCSHWLNSLFVNTCKTVSPPCHPLPPSADIGNTLTGKLPTCSLSSLTIDSLSTAAAEFSGTISV